MCSQHFCICSLYYQFSKFYLSCNWGLLWYRPKNWMVGAYKHKIVIKANQTKRTRHFISLKQRFKRNLKLFHSLPFHPLKSTSAVESAGLCWADWWPLTQCFVPSFGLLANYPKHSLLPPPSTRLLRWEKNVQAEKQDNTANAHKNLSGRKKSANMRIKRQET